MKKVELTRRDCLRGLGTAVALPWLESLVGARALAGSASSRPPVRMAFFSIPNGVHLPNWTPGAEGIGFELPATLAPLERLRDDLVILTGLTNDKARANSDGPGDHARAAACFLTGVQPYKTPGAKIQAGISVDQFAAQAVGSRTRFASLELACDLGRNTGNCDSGYSCAYSNNISWRSASTPMAKEADPKQLFDRLFGGGTSTESASAIARRELYRKSVLDFVRDDARRLAPSLGTADRKKMDEYFSSVREVEQRIERARQPTDAALPLSPPTGIPKEFADHIRLLGDLLVLAFQTDASRIATFMFAREGSNRNYREVGVSDGHHDLSHHGGDPVKHEKLSRIDRFHVAQFAYIVERMKRTPDGDGTLLDNSMVLFGSGISDGNRHNKDDLPILLAGSGGGSIYTGRHIRYERETPLCNLLLSMLDHFGVVADRFGDSTGRLPGLEG